LYSLNAALFPAKKKNGIERGVAWLLERYASCPRWYVTGKHCRYQSTESNSISKGEKEVRSAGSIIMSVFGAIWWIAGAVGSGWPFVPAYAIPFIAILVLVVAALRARDHTEPESDQDGKRTGRLVGIASGLEGAAILVAVNVVANTGTQDYTAPAIAIIVGLHFLPLARWLPAKLYYATAVALIGLGVVGIWISGAVLRLEVVCSGSACTLWVTSGLVLTTKLKSGIGIGHAA
jgi:hypothetical protein